MTKLPEIRGAVTAAVLEFPRIEDLDTKAGEILYVSRHNGEVVVNGSCGNHTVRRVEGIPLNWH